MKHGVTKLYAALIAAGLSAGAYAHVKSDLPVNVPRQHCAYFVKADLLVFRPTNDDLYYAVGGKATKTAIFHSINPHTQVGWRLEGGRNIANSGNDVDINWTHLSSRDSADAKPYDGNLSSRFNKGDKHDSVTGTARFRFNEINFEGGQKVDIHNLHTRIRGGLQIGLLEHDLDTVAIDGDKRSTADTNSDFWGVGPLVGLDTSYPGVAGNSALSVVTHATVAVLYGEIDVDEQLVNQGSKSTTKSSPISDHQNTVVPTATVRLGLHWGKRDAEDNHYAAELGVQATGYYHVIQHPLDFDKGNKVAVVNHVSNYGQAGVYLQGSWHS